MEKQKFILKLAIYLPLLVVGLWCVVALSVQRFKCPKLTETELFFSIPKAMFGEFKTCKK